MSCARGSCRHPTPSPGALGATCADANACETGSCAKPHGSDRAATCTTRCLQSADTCPTDFTCEPVATAEHACFPATSGCTTAPGAALAPVLLALGLLVRRRRRLIPLVALAACSGSGSTVATDGLTYHATVKPIIDRHCAGCHQPDGSGPMPLTELDHVLQQQEIITYMVASNEMPPWPAADSCEPYRASRALPAEQRALLLEWLRAGAPAGDPDDAGPPIEPEPEPIIAADITLELPPYLPPPAADRYRCFVLPWPATTATFVTGLAVDPGDVTTVHHVNTYAVPASRAAELTALDAADPEPGFACHGGVGSNGLFPPLIAAWTAGQGPIALPTGTGIAIEPQGAILVRLHLHHHASAGMATPIRPRIALDLAATVEAEATLVALADPAWAAELVLPPFDATSVSYLSDVAASLSSWSQGLLADGAFRLHAVELHMHERGASGNVSVVPGGAGEDCLLDIPFWSSHWPQPYTLAEPRRIAPGEALRVTCSWFNNQPLPARWGTSADDEMCVAWLYVTR
jgi:uncharacterized protein (TIGR03382 family)